MSIVGKRRHDAPLGITRAPRLMQDSRRLDGGEKTADVAPRSQLQRFGKLVDQRAMSFPGRFREWDNDVIGRAEFSQR